MDLDFRPSLIFLLYTSANISAYKVRKERILTRRKCLFALPTTCQSSNHFASCACRTMGASFCIHGVRLITAGCFNAIIGPFLPDAKLTFHSLENRCTSGDKGALVGGNGFPRPKAVSGEIRPRERRYCATSANETRTSYEPPSCLINGNLMTSGDGQRTYRYRFA